MESPSKSKQIAPAAVGIRLGSTTLTLAVSRLGDGFDGRPTVVASDTGERTIPTVVAWANGEWVIGDAAKHQAAKNPKNTFLNLLKLIGAKADDSKALQYCKGIQTSGDESNDNALLLQPINITTLASDGEPISPTTLLSMLLKKMKEIAEENVGGKVGPCIFTVPVDLTQVQCEQVTKAGVLAGFDVFQVIPEPVAICLAYKLDAPIKLSSESAQLLSILKQSSPKPPAPPTAAAESTSSETISNIFSSQLNKKVMVVDIGGSDVSVTILHFDNGIINIIATECSRDLSGSLMIQEVVKFAAMFFQRKMGANPLESKKSAMRLRQTCEGTLRFLSNASQADIEVESLYEGCDLRARISRARFEDLCDWSILDKTIQKTLLSTSMTKNDIDRVILAGGAARVPKIINRLNSLFPTHVLTQSLKEMPDEAGALGASLQASRLVCSHPLSKDTTPGQFMRDYKKSKDKFHKVIPEKKSVACTTSSLAFMIEKSDNILSLVTQNTLLPIHSLCSIHLYHENDFHAMTNDQGEFHLVLIENENKLNAGSNDKEDNKIVSFIFNNLKPNMNLNLISFLSINIQGKIDLKVRVLLKDSTNENDTNQLMQEYQQEQPKPGSEITVTIPAP